MKSLVLAEKPSVGKELARVLMCGKKAKGYWEGQGYVVTWAMGHLVELAEPHAYDEKYREWSLETLPMLPERMKHRIIGRSAQQFKTIKSLFRRQDVGTLIIATDAGREGELVARWIMRLGGWRGPIRRLWISSQTDAAIKEGFRNLKPGQDYENLFKAAECRAEADWIVGLNVTRALSCRYDARLSAGRVQTPTMAMIIDREESIRGFQPVKYWQIQADFGSFSGIWQDPHGKVRIPDQSRAEKIADKVRQSQAYVVEVRNAEKSEAPPLAYDLTALQRQANSTLGFSAQKTLNTLQSLYERHKLVTYPRTDARHITRDMVPTLKQRLQALLSSRFRTTVQELLAVELAPGRRFVDDSKVTDHHAIIPTEERAVSDRLNAEEKALWELVVRRFLAVLSAPYRYLAITIITEADGQRFVSRGQQVIERGWKTIEGYNQAVEEEDLEYQRQNLVGHQKGEQLQVASVDIKQGFTKPPPHFTEGSLLEAMENAGRFIHDRDLRQSIARGGLGTPATRAEIIEKLLANYYIERRGKTLIPTSRGYELLELVPEKLRTPELTARWEQRLTAIAEGRESSKVFRQDIRNNASNLVDLVKASRAEFKPRDLSSEPCPLCGRLMMPARDRKGRKLLICQSLSCGFEQSENERDTLVRRPSRREKKMTKRLIQQYSDHSKETATFADLIKASKEKKG